MSDSSNLPRRSVLKGAAAFPFPMMAGAEELRAAAPAAPAPEGPPVNCGVIGLGPQGREILGILSRHPANSGGRHCGYLRTVRHSVQRDGSQSRLPFTDYKQLLDNKDVQAVFIATPSHQHKQIVLDAIAAGKHVYCEAPLAVTVDEARDIAKAGRRFQAGLRHRPAYPGQPASTITSRAS